MRMEKRKKEVRVDNKGCSVESGERMTWGQFASLTILPLRFLSSIIGSRTAEGEDGKETRGENPRHYTTSRWRRRGSNGSKPRSSHACACTPPTHFLSVFSLWPTTARFSRQKDLLHPKGLWLEKVWGKDTMTEYEGNDGNNGKYTEIKNVNERGKYG